MLGPSCLFHQRQASHLMMDMAIVGTGYTECVGRSGGAANATEAPPREEPHPACLLLIHFMYLCLYFFYALDQWAMFVTCMILHGLE